MEVGIMFRQSHLLDGASTTEGMDIRIVTFNDGGSLLYITRNMVFLKCHVFPC